MDRDNERIKPRRAVGLRRIGTREIGSLTEQRRQLEKERDDLVDQRDGWAAAQDRLRDLEDWCRVQAANLGTLTFDQQQLALLARSAAAERRG